MPFKIVRNDITKMNTEAIVNTANDHVSVGTGCDSAVYKAAGYDELLKYREDNIGFVAEGVFESLEPVGFKTGAPLFYAKSQNMRKKIIVLCNLKSIIIIEQNEISYFKRKRSESHDKVYKQCKQVLIRNENQANLPHHDYRN